MPTASILRSILLPGLVAASLIFGPGCHTRRNLGGDQAHSEPGGFVIYPLEEAALKTHYAALLGVPPSSLINPQLYYFIDQWMGTPYLNGGQTRLGIDCSAFTQTLYLQAFRRNIPRTSLNQGRLISSRQIEDLQEGDLVFFSSTHGQVDHVGVYLGNSKFVHASTSKGVTISDLNQNWYHSNFVKGGPLAN